MGSLLPVHFKQSGQCDEKGTLGKKNLVSEESAHTKKQK